MNIKAFGLQQKSITQNQYFSGWFKQIECVLNLQKDPIEILIAASVAFSIESSFVLSTKTTEFMQIFIEINFEKKENNNKIATDFKGMSFILRHYCL